MTRNVVRGAAAAVSLAAAMLGGACGKKGAPLAPFLHIPAAVDMIDASRFGNDVYVTLTVPATNIDKSIPVDIARIDVYAYTGVIPPPRVRWAELGTVVATIPVAPPPVDESGAPLPPVAVPSGDAVPGNSVTVVDALTPDEFKQGALPAPDPRRADTIPLPPLPGVTAPSVLRRFYLAIPFSERGLPAPPGDQVDLVLTALPEPPTGVLANYTPNAISLSWEPSGGLMGFLLDQFLIPEPVPFETPPLPGPANRQPADASLPSGPTTYNVYRELAPDPLELPPAIATPEWRATPPMALNSNPLDSTAFNDDVEFDRAQCYSVRARRGAVVGEPSPPACFIPFDLFPPQAPEGLAAVPFEGGISLIWEPNDESDLGGYLVLRQEAGDDTLRQLTAAPIVDARFRDTTVRPGLRYIYSVVAVDTHVPLPNISTQSAPVEETAR